MCKFRTKPCSWEGCPMPGGKGKLASLWGPQTVGKTDIKRFHEINSNKTNKFLLFPRGELLRCPKTLMFSIDPLPGHAEADDPWARGEQQSGQCEIAGIAGCRDQSSLRFRSWVFSSRNTFNTCIFSQLDDVWDIPCDLKDWSKCCAFHSFAFGWDICYA